MAKHITPPVRASFVHLVTPRPPAAGADPVFSMALMMPKDDPACKKFLAALKKDYEAMVREKWGSVPKKLKHPVKDGDEEDRPEWEGHFIVNVKNSRRPGIVDNALQEIVDPEELYSGAVYRVACSPWTWSHDVGGKGVSLNLDNVQKVKDGDRFDSRTAAEDDFADFKTEEPAEEAEDSGEIEFS